MTLRIPYIIAAVIAAFSVVHLASPPGLRAAPVLAVTSLAGEQFDLAAVDGKIRLVTFISPNCAITNRNLSVLDSVQEHNSPEVLDVVGITMPYDQVEEVNRFKLDKEVQFRLVADLDGTIADAFAQVRFTPTSFLIDGNGNIATRIVGRLSASEIQQQIASLGTEQSLAQRPAFTAQ